ncbi:MAG TPA: sulfite exporter TauE/SafE family protein [Ignavibacteriales bacterium]|nr:sulfite exporter TauE/SafE family protein [Ignavibacteriales bacterium]
MEFWSAFLIGLAGSLHCAGMCGALVLALPQQDKFSFISGRALYNAGRIVSYVFLGLLFGAFGSTASLFGLQQHMSVLLGVIIILLVIVPRRYRNKVNSLALFADYKKKLQSYMGKILKKNSSMSLLFLGMLNGLLPCGMVYMALAGAVTSFGLKSAMAYMALFGLGTLPMMFTVSLMGRYAVGYGLRRNLGRVVPLLAFMLGAVFILRGMNLGIPYLSPKLPMKMNHMQMDHTGMQKAGIKLSQANKSGMIPGVNMSTTDSRSSNSCIKDNCCK